MPPGLFKGNMKTLSLAAAAFHLSTRMRDNLINIHFHKKSNIYSCILSYIFKILLGGAFHILSNLVKLFNNLSNNILLLVAQ